MLYISHNWDFLKEFYCGYCLHRGDVSVSWNSQSSCVALPVPQCLLIWGWWCWMNSYFMLVTQNLMLKIVSSFCLAACSSQVRTEAEGYQACTRCQAQSWRQTINRLWLPRIPQFWVNKKLVKLKLPPCFILHWHLQPLLCQWWTSVIFIWYLCCVQKFSAFILILNACSISQMLFFFNIN